MKFNFEKDKLIILLLLTDLAFIFLHILFMYTDFITNFIFAIWRDRGPAEFFQYMKYLWVMALFIYIFMRRRKVLFLIYSLLFFYFLIDDFFELHESVGRIIAGNLDFQMPFGLRLQDLGEMAVYAVVGGFFFTLIAILHFRSDAYTRTVSKFMVILILLLAFFGIGFDIFGMMFSDEWVSAFFNFIEDAGEMVVMSIITWFIFRLDPSTDFIPVFSAEPVKKKEKIPSEKVST